MPGANAPSGAAYVQAVDGRVELFARPGLALAPPKFAAWITDIRGDSLTVTNRDIAWTRVSCTYGNDRLRLDNIRMDMDDVVRGVLRFQDIAGSAVFNPPSPMYPAPVGSVIARLHPGGEYSVNGWLMVDTTGASTPSTDLDLRIRTDNGQMAVTDFQFPLTAIRSDAQITGERVWVQRLAANTCGGSATASGIVRLTSMAPYDAVIEATQIDVKQLGRQLQIDDPSGKLSGVAQGRAAIRGECDPTMGDALSALSGSGSANISNGSFWEMPLFRDVPGMAHVARESMTVGKLDANFTLGDSQAKFSKLNVSSGAVGMEATGAIGFNGDLDLNAVIAPLADWKAKVQSTGVPIIGDIAGGLQKLMNTATGTLLYAYRITGTVSKPQQQVVPAPFITDTMAKGFAEMMQGK
jgi:hypothetical protein